MLLMPNLDVLRSAGQSLPAPPTPSKDLYHGDDGFVLGSETWPQYLQLPWNGLVQADGRPFANVGMVETRGMVPTWGSGFLQAFGASGCTGAFFANGTPWVKVNEVDLYVGHVEQQLLSLQSNLSQLYHLGPTPEFDSLYSQANQLGVGTGRLRRALRLAAENTEEACRFLAAEIRSAIAGKIAYLRRRLRIANALKSRLLRLFASVYRFHNQIILQRRYYLAHGSHPIENFTCAQTQWGLDQRGCVPAFLQ
jgi:hypothetical protein